MRLVFILLGLVVGFLRLVFPFAFDAPRASIILLAPFLACVAFVSVQAWGGYVESLAAGRRPSYAARRLPSPQRNAARTVRVLTPLDLCRAES
jgi:hypothetical protein